MSHEEASRVAEEWPPKASSAAFNWADEADSSDAEEALSRRVGSVSLDAVDGGGAAGAAAAAAPMSGQAHKVHFLTAGELEVQQADPNSPLHSAAKFEDLHLRDELLKGVYKLGYHKPSKIQGLALPLILADPPVNMVAQSQSGTGKTAAFVLGMLSRLDSARHSPQALCVSPSRELAIQTFQVAKELGQFIPDLQCLMAVKGEPLPPAGAPLTAQIIIGSPGTILELIHTHGSAFAHVRVIVFDEADQMFDQSSGGGRGHHGKPAGKKGGGGGGGGSSMADQSKRIKSFCDSSAKGHALQTLLFSATYEGKCREWSEKVVGSNKNVLRLRQEELAHKSIQQFVLQCPNYEAKEQALADIFNYLLVGQTIVFVNRKDEAAKLNEKMRSLSHEVSFLSSELNPAQRDETMERFRSGKERLMIATNVIARGLDIESVSIVVNFDVPFDAKHQPDPATYLHRIGRTGRFGRSGLAFTFVSTPEENKALQQIVQHIQTTVQPITKDDLLTLQEDLEKKGHY